MLSFVKSLNGLEEKQIDKSERSLTSNYRAVPDSRILSNGDGADHRCIWSNKHVLGNGRTRIEEPHDSSVARDWRKFLETDGKEQVVSSYIQGDRERER